MTVPSNCERVNSPNSAHCFGGSVAAGGSKHAGAAQYPHAASSSARVSLST